ncbi:hypothetical protein D8674_007149 [Pyrus ussuriensis x Pyrus communis]|uniref:Uncharacterized protein n=1 Tax=Pyrus ussuriensis x Pyrus communis TaxID=2448454 RepID=A0A5N5G233_9ROSA|nr:hypothetical protein D8674_007149 [Pyrus ussuriensis x Pyrus communis]
MSQLITRRWSVTTAPPALSASTAPPMSAPLIQEPTPLAKATSTTSQVPVSLMSSVSVQLLSAWWPHRRRHEPEPSDHTSSASKVKGEVVSNFLYKFKPKQHSFIASSCGVVIRDNCPFQWESWAEIPEDTKELFIYDLDDISLEAMAYLERTLSIWYKHWKNNFHNYFKKWDNLEIARLHVPSELKDRPEDWEWLYKHFTDPNFVEGSKFPDIDMFKDVYVHPGNETDEQFYDTMVEKSTAVLQEAASQLPPETSIEDVMVLEDVGFQFMTEVLDQNLGRRHGQVVRGMGKSRVRETGASSSRSNTAEVDALMKEVTTLRGKLAMQEEHMREQMRAQGEQMRAQSDQMREQMRAQDDKMKAQLRA